MVNIFLVLKVVAWTNEGRCMSEPATKKTPLSNKGWKQKPWKTKEELLDWLNTHDATLNTNRSSKSSRSLQSHRSFSSVTTIKSQSSDGAYSPSKSHKSIGSQSRNSSTRLSSIKEKPRKETQTKGKKSSQKAF